MRGNNYDSEFFSCSALKFHVSLSCYCLHAEGREAVHKISLETCGIRNKQYNYFRTVYLQKILARNEYVCSKGLTMRCI